MTETTSHMIDAAQACLNGEDFGMSTADLVEDMMHELVRLQRDNEQLERQYNACKGANKGLDKAMWEARDLLAEIDAELDRQLYDDEHVRSCRNNDLDIMPDTEHHVIIKHELWEKIAEAAEPSKQSGFPYPENEPAF